MAKQLDPNSGLMVETPGEFDPALASANADLAEQEAYKKLSSLTLANKSPDYMTEDELKEAYLQNPKRADVSEKIREKGIDINSIYKTPTSPAAAATGATGSTGAGTGLVAPPTYKAPDTSAIDADIDKYAPTYDPATIQKELDLELAGIAEKWGLERRKAEQQTENERMSQISNLYGVGVVNPASSGLASIGSASLATKDQRLAAINTQENAEKLGAVSKAYGLKTSAQKSALEYAQGKKTAVEKKATDEYNRQKEVWNASLKQVNDAAAAVKSGIALDKETKDQAQENIKTMLSAGSSVFEGTDATELANLEKAAGWPKGTLEKAIAEKKKQEMLGRKIFTTKDGIFVMEVGKDGVAKLVPVLKMNKKTTPETETPTTPKKTSNYTATTIPKEVKGDLLADIEKGMPLDDAYTTYPEVATSYIKSLYPTKKTPSSGDEEEREV